MVWFNENERISSSIFLPALAGRGRAVHAAASQPLRGVVHVVHPHDKIR